MFKTDRVSSRTQTSKVIIDTVFWLILYLSTALIGNKPKMALLELKYTIIQFLQNVLNEVALTYVQQL